MDDDNVMGTQGVEGVDTEGMEGMDAEGMEGMDTEVWTLSRALRPWRAPRITRATSPFTRP